MVSEPDPARLPEACERSGDNPRPVVGCAKTERNEQEGPVTDHPEKPVLCHARRQFKLYRRSRSSPSPKPLLYNFVHPSLQNAVGAGFVTAPSPGAVR